MITKNKIREISTLCIAVLFVLLQACGSTANENHEEHDAHESGHTEEARTETDHNGHDHEAGSLMAVREELGADQVLITARQKENADVQLAHPSKENLSRVVKAFGSVSLPPHAEASVTPVIGGIVRDIRVIEGDEVQKGEVVARIEHPDVADLQQAYLEAVNEDKYLESEYNRQKRLLRDSVNAARTVQKLESEYENNRARLQSLKKKLQMIHLDPGQINPENITSSYPLKASVSGTIASVFVNAGVHVSEQKEIFHIANINEAHLDLEVFEKDIRQIEPGQRLTFNLTNNPFPNPLSGTILKKSSRFDTESRKALVHATVDDKNTSLLPGMGVTAFIQSGENRVWALPSSAIVTEEGHDYVFRLVQTGPEEEPEHNGHEHENSESGQDHEAHVHEQEEEEEEYFIFERTEVNTSQSRGNLTEVTFPDATFHEARFATGNAQALSSEMKSGSAGHQGHAH